MTPARAASLLALVALCAVLSAGCNESVDPNLGIDRAYTMWGLFNPSSDTQAARIFVIDDAIRPIPPEPLDAVITSTDMTTGEVRVWRDSVVQVEGRGFRHVYWSPFRAEHGHTYRLDARHPDGNNAWAQVKVPMPASLLIVRPTSGNITSGIQPVAIAGSPPSLPRIEVVYEIYGADPRLQAGVLVTASYANRTTMRQDTARLDINLRQDFRDITVLLALRGIEAQPIGLRGMTIRVHVGHEGWVSPTGVFDADLMVDPGVLTNVENGFGFVGAGYMLEHSWRPPEDLIQNAGFSGS